MAPQIINQAQNGYLAEEFAATQSQQVTRLDCGGQLIERPIAGTELRDACNPYPLFCSFRYDAQDLYQAARAVPSGNVSLTLVTSPLFDFDDSWESGFDRVSEYKCHFIVDLKNWSPDQVSRHHIKSLKTFTKRDSVVKTELAGDVSRHYHLYELLMQRHEVTSEQPAFLTGSQFESVCAVPGSVMFETASQDSWSLFYTMNDDAYYHLNASSESGYKKSASYGIMFEAIQHFKREGYRYVVLGAGAGTSQASQHLANFKQGWGTFSRNNFILGKIFDSQSYERLSAGKDPKFFPAYRRAAPIMSR